MAGSGYQKSCKEFLDELCDAEQQHRIKSNLQNKTNKPRKRYVEADSKQGISKLGPSTEDVVWFQGQARYGRDRRALKKPYINHRKGRKCYNCGGMDHHVSDCKKQRDDDRIMTSHLRDLMKNRTSDQRVKVLQNLLSEQPVHINFLADELYEQIQDNTEESKLQTQGYASDSTHDSTDSESAGEESEVSNDVMHKRAWLLKGTKAREGMRRYHAVTAGSQNYSSDETTEVDQSRKSGRDGGTSRDAWEEDDEDSYSSGIDETDTSITEHDPVMKHITEDDNVI